MHPMLTIAIRAVRQASNFVTKRYEELNSIKVIEKKRNNFMANINKKAEKIIIESIQKSYPTHTFLTEESAQIISKKNNTIQWIINPLNGAINFSKGFPHFSISIAVRINDRTEVAAIYNPILNELFTAVRGQGAQLNSHRLRITNNNELKGAIIATGFPFKKKEYLGRYVNIIGKLFKKCTDFRRTGSTSLDLAYVAANRIDAFFEIGLKPLDFIAAELLVREAGGVITDFIDENNHFSSGNLLAGSPRILRKILLEMQTECSNPLKVKIIV